VPARQAAAQFGSSPTTINAGAVWGFQRRLQDIDPASAESRKF
jgi:hypothetical protein